MDANASAAQARRILVMGATGYIGGLVVPRLLEAGFPVRCLVRDKTKLSRQPWATHVEVVEGDALQLDTLAPAFSGIDVVYYLVHSMGAGGGSDFAQQDRHAASNTALAAKEQGVGRIIYLGGLGQEGTGLSEHLASRQETGRVLASHGVPVTEFRAAVIVGAGSLSFRMVRYLSERLPVMITPRWVSTRVQPIAEADVVRYLVDALDVSESAGRVLEIGGADVLTYGQMITRYARLRGLRRTLIPVPVLTPTLSAYWVDLVTPIPASIAHPFIEGLKTEVVVRDPAAREIFGFEPVGYEEAVRRVLVEQPQVR